MPGGILQAVRRLPAPILIPILILAVSGLACGDDGGGTDAATSEIPTTDPGTTDPGTTDPGTSDPGTSDPGTSDPGTTDPGTTDPTGGDPTFSGDIYPDIIAMNCSCHISGMGIGGLAMPDAATAYANLVSVESTGSPGETLVVPADASSSYLVAKLRGTQAVGAQMPLGLDPLPETEIFAIEAWIDAGAPE